ncbi:MAG: SGNH/GDSL hydrolase family protein [Lachnospiraceae bacterium]|nr:SGNH/GDSL hydrolase family protein [Lachnospiraceae bacterium]
MTKKILKIMLLLAMIASICFCSFAATDVLVPRTDKTDLFDMGPGYASEIAVAGDSYAKHFYDDEKNREIKLHGYFNEGYTLEMNYNTLRQAFNSLYKIVFLSISVNDRHKSTHPSEFETELRELFDIAKRTGKIVLVHSYMYYDLAFVPNFPYSPFEYDSMIRNLIMQYDNVYYIDMSDCTGSEYMLQDGIHYNKKFNDIMYDRVVFMIDWIGRN